MGAPFSKWSPGGRAKTGAPQDAGRGDLALSGAGNTPIRAPNGPNLTKDYAALTASPNAGPVLVRLRSVGSRSNLAVRQRPGERRVTPHKGHSTPEPFPAVPDEMAQRRRAETTKTTVAFMAS